MALLHYQNLGGNRPDILLSRAFYGLKPFYDFLRGTKTHLESDTAVRRLAWVPGSAPGGESPAPDAGRTGYWVLLQPPPDRPNEPEATFREFMDENVRSVFESDTRRFGREAEIAILDRDPETCQLRLASPPRTDQLLLRPATLTLHRQIQALQALQDAPSAMHRPLLRLFEAHDHALWPPVTPQPIGPEDWMVLTDPSRQGTGEQREFVSRALGTPDFALLEGPPGSGKTTAICELAMQLAKQGKRVLLCASTHVAVDNVLERLMSERNRHRDLVIPIRIGDRSNVSDKARPWQFDHFIQTERKRLLENLQRQKVLTESQHSLLTAIRQSPSVIERLVLDAANLVCGTTIGILQHPDIRGNAGRPPTPFDVLILDEASKTTFQEFLVPALLARRWIIVGDVKQLSPFVDDDAMRINVEACLANESLRNACVDVFLAGHRNPGKRRIAVITDDGGLARPAYAAQAKARGIDIADADVDRDLATAAVVIGSSPLLDQRSEELPLDTTTVRAPEDALVPLRRRVNAWLRRSGRRDPAPAQWGSEIAWRLVRHYDQRFAETPPQEGRQGVAARLQSDLTHLLPGETTGASPEEVWRKIDGVRRVALPSIIELLRHGFEREPQQRQGTALSDGMPKEAVAERHVLLSTQHRMHPDIAEFSHLHVYGGQALNTPDDMAGKRAWTYPAHRALWVDVRGQHNKATNSNRQEAQAIIRELQRFDAWARVNPREDGDPWEIAILAFYRGQEREIREHVRRWSGQHMAIRRFSRGGKDRPHATIELCTVDRFQGHEADLVMISFASAHPTSFLESPNRLNVALTRARFQRIIVGDRLAMDRSNGLLGKLARETHWEKSLGRDE